MAQKAVIIELTNFALSELQPYHRNPRRGDVGAIAESLQINGQYRPIIVNLGRQTGRPLEVLAGNHTLAAAGKLGWETISATTVDVDDTQAARIVAADNRTADLGDYDNAGLADLLKDLDDLAGTGYTPDDLDDLIGAIDDDSDQKEPDSVPYEGRFELVIECSGEDQQEDLFRELSERGLTCRLLTL